MDRWIGRVAVVTGASSGIGAATAVALADAGMTVVGLARRSERIEKLKAKVKGKGLLTARLCDVSKSDQVRDTFSWIEGQFGGIDVIVNNAAVFNVGHITEVGSNTLSEDAIVSLLDINIKGVMLCTRYAVASMKKRNFQGHIININSIAGHYIPFTDTFNIYPASKHVITAFTQSLAVEFACYGSAIRTTSISPGLVATELLSSNISSPEEEQAMRKCPILNSEDVAAAVVYALSTPAHVNISELTIQPVGERRL